MFDNGVRSDPGPGTSGAGPDAPALLTSQTVASWVAGLRHVDRALSDAERIDQIRRLEELKAAAAAAQAVLTVDFAESQRAKQRAASVRSERVGQGIAAQVALARRESPFRGSRHLGLAEALVREMPSTMAALAAGQVSEWRATIVARETACLSVDERRVADAELADRLPRMSDGEVEAAARKIAYRLDAHAFVARAKGEEKNRRVSLRPAPDTMSRLTGFLPVARGVAAWASLAQEADRLVAAGDPRSRGQIMADAFVERLTGQAVAAGPPVELNLVMSDSTLFGRDDEPADLVDGGPLPAPVARALVGDTKAAVWVRRLFTRPGEGALVAMESRRRLFPDALKQFLTLRDQVCRTPWCGAPVRHSDHVVARAEGGETSAANGQGLCAGCNYAKEAPGWRARPGPRGAGDEVEITTPTGHTYTSQPPPLPLDRPLHRGRARAPAWPIEWRALEPDGGSLVERALRRWLAAA